MGRTTERLGTGSDAERRSLADAPGDDADGVALARFLAEVGGILGDSLDIDATLQSVARLAVPTLADWCAIDLLDGAGRLTPLAVAHQDPSQVALVEALRREFPPEPETAGGAYAVVRERRTMTAEVTEAMLVALARDERHAALLTALRVRTWMCVPMIAGDRVYGTISLAGADPERPFGPRLVMLAEQLAMCAAAALENARAVRTADRSRRILDTVAEAVFVLDPSTSRIREVNRGAADLLGIPAEALVDVELWGYVAGPDGTSPATLLEPLLDGRVDARTVTMTARPHDRDPFPVEVLLQRMDLPGEPDAIVASARDIRDRVEAQAGLERLPSAGHARAAELHAVIRAIGDGVVVCDRDGAVTLANPAALAILGVSALTTYDEVTAALRDPGKHVPALGRAYGPVVVATTADRDRWIELTTYPLTATGAATPGGQTIVVVRDVTAARQRETIRETFIGILSHELRTPVTTIYGGAKLLARRSSTVDDEVRQSIFEDIAAESERLQRLVEDVVAMNRFGEASSDLGQEPVLLQRVVPAVLASEEQRWPGIRFELSVPSGVPTVVADPVYVEQTVRNLLSNAAKYGGPASTIRVVIEPHQGEVHLRILDDGPGIEAAEADRLFELFYRSPHTSGATAGAGIGLFVCARLVRAMGGRIWALPRPEGGAEFGFALRVMAED